MDQLILKLNQIIEGLDDLYLHTPITSSQIEAKLTDLGIDSLGRINLFYAVIDDFGVEVDEVVASQWMNVRDVLEFMKEQS